MALVTTFRMARCRASGSKTAAWACPAPGCQCSVDARVGRPGLHQFDHVADHLIQFGRHHSGLRSLLNVSMSMTRLEIFSWFFSTMAQPLRISSVSPAFSPSSIR